ncbi:cytochrome P450 [Mycena polygramma]|nr:cytochrome P450 [Mycena polygramma]
MSLLYSSLGTGLILALGYLYFKPRRQSSYSGTKIRQLGGFWLLNAWAFFTKRYDFIGDAFRRTGEKVFRFRILKYNVIGVSGTDARTLYFSDKGLNLGEGYKILMGGGPDVNDIKLDAEVDRGIFIRQLSTVMTKDRLQDVFPSLLSDVSKLMDGWGSNGIIDPFTEIQKLVFQVTVRLASCRELTEDAAAVSRIQDLYHTLEKSSTPVALLLPWFPSAARKSRAAATTELFTMLYGYVEGRRNAAVPSSDAIDVLLAEGNNSMSVVEFIFGSIFAGVLNSGFTACWSLVYLGMDPIWKAKAIAEIQTLVAEHSSGNALDPLHIRLSTIPVSAWEDMPVLEAVIRETLRLTITSVSLRRNIIHDLPIGTRKIDRGDFVVYRFGDVHLDPAIYPEPYKFDPERYDVGRAEDTRAPFAFLGWGAGRHACAGVKVAKIEMKMVLALFLLGFDYEIVSPTGKLVTDVPQIDRNDIHSARPLTPCSIKFNRTRQ